MSKVSMSSFIPSGTSITSSLPVRSSCTVISFWAFKVTVANAEKANKIIFFIFIPVLQCYASETKSTTYSNGVRIRFTLYRDYCRAYIKAQIP